MPINSRAKGQRNERLAAKEFTEVLGIKAERGQQRSGSPDSPDIKVDVEGLHVEVKCVQALNLGAAYAQSERDAGPDKLPVVMHRKDRGDWFLTLKFKHIPKLLEILK